MDPKSKILHFITFFVLILGVFSDGKNFIRNCEKVNEKGIYSVLIDEESRPFKVLCDEFFGAKWTLVMNRFNGDVDFLHRTKDSFKFGFGNFDNEFFLGLDQLNALTSDKPHMVLFMMKDFNDKEYISTYDVFEVRDETFYYSTGDMIFAHSGLDIGFTKFNAFCDGMGKTKCENNVPGWQTNPYAEPKGLATKTAVQMFGAYPQNENDKKFNNFGIFYREKNELIPLKSLKMLIRPFKKPDNYKKYEHLTYELDLRFFGNHPLCSEMNGVSREERCKHALA